MVYPAKEPLFYSERALPPLSVNAKDIRIQSTEKWRNMDILNILLIPKKYDMLMCKLHAKTRREGTDVEGCQRRKSPTLEMSTLSRKWSRNMQDFVCGSLNQCGQNVN